MDQYRRAEMIRTGIFFILAVTIYANEFEFPENEYVYSVKREWLIEAEKKLQGLKPSLTDDEMIVDQYLGFRKWEEFQRTRNSTADNFPPSRPIEEMQDNIKDSEVYRCLQHLPKGGNMHSHEYHQLSKRLLLEIVWSSPEFEHLYILPENHPTLPWTLNFFLNPPAGEGWIKVKDNDNYTLEEILKHQTFLGILSDYAKGRPTDSGQRWRELDVLWFRGSFQIAGLKSIKVKYLEEMYKQGLDEGVQYIETRRSFSDMERIYELDPASEYEATNGKKYFSPEAEVELTRDVIANVTASYPHFIGHKRIGFVHRMASFADATAEFDTISRLHKLYPNLVIGADMVGQEDAGNSHLYYLETLLALWDKASKQMKIPLYMHTSETNFLDELRYSSLPTDLVSTLQNTYEALLIGSKRIGHGFGFIKHPYLMQVLRERNIAVEICPVSNQLLGYAPDMRNHPGIHYLRSGIPVVLGSDDPGTFGVDPFTIDWYEAFMAWGLELADLKQLAMSSLQYSGMTDTEKQDAIVNKWTPQWNTYIGNMKTEACDAVINSNDAVFVRILPREGAIVGTTNVHIFGRHFEKGICKTIRCKFGDKESGKAIYITTEHLVCETPTIESSEETEVNVWVSFDDGQNYQDTGETFIYKYERYVTPDPNESGSANGLWMSPLVVLFSTSAAFLRQ